MPNHVLFVCTGNICRSAMAEMVLLDRLLAAGVTGVRVSSAGVSAEEQGNPMDARAVRVLREQGYGRADSAVGREVAARISAHRAHRVTDADLADADLILAMTRGHYRELLGRVARVEGAGTVCMYREFDPLISGELAKLGTPSISTVDGAAPDPWDLPALLDVPDPWYGGMADFLETLETVERVSDSLASSLTA